MSREFCDLYRDAIEAVEDNWPGFWTGLAEELRQHQEGNVTTGGAIVREFPAQREAEAQAVVATRDAAAGTSAVTTRDAAAGTSAVTTRDAAAGTNAVTRREAAVQVEPGDWLHWDTSSEEDEEKSNEAGFGGRTPPERDPQARPGGPASPAHSAMPDSTSHEEGCWNCGSRAHRARKCPRQQRLEFCFRCGTKGYTVKTCPHCGAGWKAQGPYIRGRGHEGPEPLRGRRARSGARPAPY